MCPLISKNAIPLRYAPFLQNGYNCSSGIAFWTPWPGSNFREDSIRILRCCWTDDDIFGATTPMIIPNSGEGPVLLLVGCSVFLCNLERSGLLSNNTFYWSFHSLKRVQKLQCRFYIRVCRWYSRVETVSLVRRLSIIKQRLQLFLSSSFVESLRSLQVLSSSCTLQDRWAIHTGLA